MLVVKNKLMRTGSKDSDAVPDYLYKYRSLSGDNRERTLRWIVGGVVWFSRPSDFMDQKDCNLQVSYDATPKKFMAKANAALAAEMPGLSERERADLIAKVLARGDHADPERIDAFRTHHQGRISERGVLSLASVSDSELMWRKYADDHRGCCLQFKRSLKGMFANVEKVRYEKHLRELNYYDQPYVQMNDRIMLTKEKGYEFENEWRIWDPRGPGYWAYDKGDLTGLIFGRRMAEEHKKLLAYLMQRSQPAAQLYDATETKNGLIIIPAEFA